MTSENRATTNLQQLIAQSKTLSPSTKVDKTSIDREIKKQVATEISKINPTKFSIDPTKVAKQLQIVLDALLDIFKKRCS